MKSLGRRHFVRLLLLGGIVFLIVSFRSGISTTLSVLNVGIIHRARFRIWMRYGSGVTAAKNWLVRCGLDRKSRFEFFGEDDGSGDVALVGARMMGLVSASDSAFDAVEFRRYQIDGRRFGFRLLRSGIRWDEKLSAPFSGYVSLMFVFDERERLLCVLIGKQNGSYGVGFGDSSGANMRHIARLGDGVFLFDDEISFLGG